MPTNSVFECTVCDFKCSKQSNYNVHLRTQKHLKKMPTIIEPSEEKTNTPTSFACTKCKKTYKARNSLWYHEQKCNGINTTTIENVFLDIKSLILEVMKSNSDLQQQNHAIQKQLLDVCKNTNNVIISNNNNNNKTFNLQFFLNEQCKDAMNITDFANSFDLQLSDLETVGELGYVEGITKIMMDKLNSMDIYKRPIHCSDAKREIIYVKDADVWAKEEKNNPKLRQAIKNVSFRNMKLVYNWSNAYPESKDSESRLNDTYMKLVIESTGGKGPILESENKIIHRIAKEIVIDKTHNWHVYREEELPT